MHKESAHNSFKKKHLSVFSEAFVNLPPLPRFPEICEACAAETASLISAAIVAAAAAAKGKLRENVSVLDRYGDKRRGLRNELGPGD